MRAEAILPVHAAALDAVLDALPAMALVLGHDDAIEVASRRAAAALGHRPKELMGRPVSRLLHRAEDAGRLAAVLAGGPSEASIPLRCADGAALALRLDAGRCADGRTVLTLGPMADAGAGRPARASDRTLRTAMDAILGYAQLLHLAELDPWHRRHVEAILSAGETLAGLLAERSRADAASGPAANSLDLHALLEEVVARGRGTAREKGLRLALSLSLMVPRRVASDRAGLRRMLDASIDDAVAATREGGVTLRADALQEGARGVRLRFQVCDTRHGTAARHGPPASAPLAGLAPGSSLATCRDVAAALGADMALADCPGGVCQTLEVRATSEAPARAP